MNNTCPPTEVYYRPELFAGLDGLVRDGKLKNYGVSVEKVEQALKAIEYPGVKTVQIIFNMFRHRPAELLFREAGRRNIGILARVPLASGLLTGKLSRGSTFDKDDHRNYNRDGRVFDRGETFSGVDFDRGLKAVEEIRKILPEGMTMAQFALRWILSFNVVSCAIPGSKRPSQAEDNAAASDLPALSSEQLKRIKEIYEEYIKTDVHQRW